MTGYAPLPRPRHEPDVADETQRRVHHELLRLVREAAQTRSPMPGELELTTRIDCTRQQLRNAMSDLESHGIVRRRQGAVTTVDPIALRMSVRLEEQYEHAELLDRMGFRSQVDVLASRTGPLPAAAAAVMELPTDTPSVSVRKRWWADEQVAMIADDVVPVDGPTPFDPNESIFTVISRVWGEPVVWEVTTPGVAVLDDEMAGLFERPAGSPVMTLELIGIGASGRRLLHSVEYHAPDVVSYSLVRTVRPPWSTA
ncbi:GntR family transcriptional regulator [Microbacterium sp. LRZ72]|uniref:GntR family transcriptional regulator n=1 Tax=Microbacterium sp. LRZ72 TaxID=2942481 RepID=UPI0029B2735A|nr:GntR family transcriptional regulator [Microbacterium sp. LRZ72]MDX2377799.1 GntR family transcriptional regulator [Microbacterium sp. LRZ72]